MGVGRENVKMSSRCSPSSRAPRTCSSISTEFLFCLSICSLFPGVVSWPTPSVVPCVMTNCAPPLPCFPLLSPGPSPPLPAPPLPCPPPPTLSPMALFLNRLASSVVLSSDFCGSQLDAAMARVTLLEKVIKDSGLRVP